MRVFWGIVWIAAGLIIFGFFIGWWGTDDPPETENQIVENQIVSGPQYTPPPARTTMRSEREERPLYWFFRDLFGGIDDGLTEGRLEMQEQVSDVEMNLTGNGNDNLIFLDRLTDARASSPESPVRRRSIRAIIDSPVTDSEGRRAGSVYDILIDPSTGAAEIIIVEMGGKQIAMSYDRVMRQTPQGNTLVDADGRRLVQRTDFDYTPDDLRGNMSLRMLTHGQVLDVDGNAMGQIGSVIFENGRVQEVYFKVRRAMTPTPRETYLIPLRETKLIQNPDGYDVQLDAEQTRAIAAEVLDGQ
jgi:sporulation protein YlmC with PRC-barrel domain